MQECRSPFLALASEQPPRPQEETAGRPTYLKVPAFDTTVCKDEVPIDRGLLHFLQKAHTPVGSLRCFLTSYPQCPLGLY